MNPSAASTTEGNAGVPSGSLGPEEVPLTQKAVLKKKKKVFDQVTESENQI